MNKKESYYQHGLSPLDFNTLTSFVNTKESFKLKHIIRWCLKEQCMQLGWCLLSYIKDNKLEDMESEYIVNHIPFNEFAEQNKAEEYNRYLGYSMYNTTEY